MAALSVISQELGTDFGGGISFLVDRRSQQSKAVDIIIVFLASFGLEIALNGVSNRIAVR